MAIVTDDPREARGQAILDDLARRAGVPRVAFLHMSAQRVAQAGLLDDRKTIAATTFLIDLLTDSELEATLAHELKHFVDGGVEDRAHEFEADAYAVRITRHPEALISALNKISRFNSAKESLRADATDDYHPSLHRRIGAIHGLARELGLEPRGWSRMRHAVAHAVEG